MAGRLTLGTVKAFRFDFRCRCELFIKSILLVIILEKWRTALEEVKGVDSCRKLIKLSGHGLRYSVGEETTGVVK